MVARALRRRAVRRGSSGEDAEKARKLAEYFERLAIDPAADLFGEPHLS